MYDLLKGRDPRGECGGRFFEGVERPSRLPSFRVSDAGVVRVAHKRPRSEEEAGKDRPGRSKGTRGARGGGGAARCQRASSLAKASDAPPTRCDAQISQRGRCEKSEGECRGIRTLLRRRRQRRARPTRPGGPSRACCCWPAGGGARGRWWRSAGPPRARLPRPRRPARHRRPPRRRQSTACRRLSAQRPAAAAAPRR